MAPVVDSVSGTTNVANIFASKFGALLNKHSSSQYSLLTSVQASLTFSHLSSVINPRRACAARVTVVVPCVCVCVCVCVCFQGLHLRLVQLSDKLGILVISVSCSLVFKFWRFSLFGEVRVLVHRATRCATNPPFYILRACVYIQRTRVCI